MNTNDIAELVTATVDYINNLPEDSFENGYFDIEKFLSSKGDEEEGIEKHKTILKDVGIIDRSRGTRLVTKGSRFGDDSVTREMEDIILLENKLFSTNNKLSKSEAIACVGGNEERFERAARVLSLAGIAKRVRGAILLRAPNAEETITAVDPTDVEKKQEAEYYQAAMDFIEQTIANTAHDDAYEFGALISGGRKRLTGPWNTPDVVGWWVEECPALYSASLRVVSAEVKLKLDRHGIAQALSYSRFSHYSWLLVPVPRQTLVPDQGDLVSECAVAGIGLACFAQQNSKSFIPYITPAYSRPDEVQLNKMLQTIFSEETDYSPSYREIANIVRRMIGRAESSV